MTTVYMITMSSPGDIDAIADDPCFYDLLHEVPNVFATLKAAKSAAIQDFHKLYRECAEEAKGIGEPWPETSPALKWEPMPGTGWVAFDADFTELEFQIHKMTVRS